MREIGVRELKSSLSKTLRDVSRGGRVRVTAHGRPLADIVPAGSAVLDDRLAALIAAGRVTPSTKPHSRPPRPVRTRISPTEIILREREAER